MTAKPVALNWSNAHALEGWLLVPLADTSSPFAAEHKHTYRYLVARNTTGSAFTGQIVEVVLEGESPLAGGVEQAVVAATKQLRAAPQTPAQLPGITGLLLFYSPAYHYETGFVYRQGQPLAERVRFLRSAKTTAPATPPTKGSTPQGAIDNPGIADCVMELRCGYVNGDLSNCIYVAHCYDSPGGGGDGGGGWGGGGGSVDDTPELQQFEQDYRSQMSSTELTIYDNMTRVQQISYLLNAQRAINIAQSRYPNSVHNGNGDAFRHAFFSELNTATLGVALAKQLGDAHEQQSSNPLETQMDLFNNEQGRQVSSIYQEQAIVDLVTSGRLRIIANGILVPSY